jgi:hypothetical protein
MKLDAMPRKFEVSIAFAFLPLGNGNIVLYGRPSETVPWIAKAVHNKAKCIIKQLSLAWIT